MDPRDKTPPFAVSHTVDGAFIQYPRERYAEYDFPSRSFYFEERLRVDKVVFRFPLAINAQDFSFKSVKLEELTKFVNKNK